MKIARIAGLSTIALLVASPARAAITLNGSTNQVCMTYGGLVSCASVTVTVAPPAVQSGSWWRTGTQGATTSFTATVTNLGGNIPAAEYLLSGFGFFQSGTSGTTMLALTSAAGNSGWSNAAPADGLVPGLPSGYRWLTTNGSGGEGVAEASPAERLESGQSRTLVFSLSGAEINFPVYFAFRGQAYGADGNGSFRCYEGLSSTAAAAGVTGTPVCGGPPTVVPEPATMALLATGLVGLGGAGLIRRRRKNV